MSQDKPIELSPIKKEKEFLTESTREVAATPDIDTRDSFEIELESAESQSTRFAFTRDFATTLFVLWFGNFLTSLDGTIVSTTMSNIAADFNQSNLVTWIATSYLLTSTAFQPLYGKTSDILGRKELLLTAQTLFCLGIFLSALAVNVQTLALARAIAGMGGAGIYALSSIIISDLVPLSQRSIYMGYGGLVSSTSQMLGGPIGGLCIVTIGWRMMFLVQVPMLLICIGLLWLKVDIKVEHIPEGKEKYSKENLKRIDVGGIITLNLAVSAIIFLLSTDEYTTTTYRVIFSLLLITSLIGYVYVEKYIAVEKIIDPEILKGQIGVLGLINGLSSLSVYMVLFIVPLYLQVVQGVSVTSIGFYTMFFVISTAVSSLIAGYSIRKHDKSEADTMVSSVAQSLMYFIIQTIGFVILLVTVSQAAPNSSGLLWRCMILLSMVISGYGAGGYFVGVSIFVIGKAGKKGQASANTVVSLIKQLGNVLGVSISFSTYTKAISSELHDYFLHSDANYIQNLVDDTNFIRNGLPAEHLISVLNIYRAGITKSFYPPLFLSLFGLSVMFILHRRVKQEFFQ